MILLIIRRVGLAISLFISVGIYAAEKGPIVVAVAPLEAVFIDGAKTDAAQKAATAMESLLQSQLSDEEHITLVERTAIDQVLREQSLALSGLIDPATAARVGRLLKADVVVVGRVRPLDATGRLAIIRAVGVEDSRVLWSGEAQGDDGALAGQAASLGAALANELRRGDSGRVGPVGVTPLRAVRHHERAAALRSVGAQAEAATEELLALQHDPSFVDAEAGFITTLAAAGFERLAAVEVKAAIERGTLPADAPIRALATATAMPTPTRGIERGESLSASNLRKFIDIIERRVRSATAESITKARKDEVRAWVMLGDLYVAEQRDRKAKEAYKQALTKLWSLRASDPSMALEEEFVFKRICVTAAEKIIEDLAWNNGFFGNIGTEFREITFKQQVLPAGALLPVSVFRAELPVTERVLIPAPRDNTWNMLVRVKRGEVPAAATLTNCWIEGLGKSGRSDSFPIVHIETRWVAAEANAVFARSGVAWPAYGSFGNDLVLGRQIYSDQNYGRNAMRMVLTECLRGGDQDYGFGLRGVSSVRLEKPPEIRVGVEFVLPAGAATAGFTLAPKTRFRMAVYAFLTGDKTAARRELTTLMSDYSSSEHGIFNANEILNMMGAE